MKNKPSPATLKKCDLSVLTIDSPPQSRETVHLKEGNRIILILFFPIYSPKVIASKVSEVIKKAAEYIIFMS